LGNNNINSHVVNSVPHLPVSHEILALNNKINKLAPVIPLGKLKK
jgi:hypothetical protein